MKDSPRILLLPVVVIMGAVGFMFAQDALSPMQEEIASVEEKIVEIASSTLEKVPSEDKKISTIDFSNVYFKASIEAPAPVDSNFERTADVFVSATLASAGIDSRTGNVVKFEKDQISQSDDGSIVEIEFGSFYKYSKEVFVSVVGLMEGEYELNVTMTDTAGAIHEFSYTSSTSEKIVDTYEFTLDSSNVSVHRSDFRNIETVWPKLKDDAGMCDATNLEGQLVQLMNDAGWDMEAVPLVKKQVGFIDGMDPHLLPFETEKVCAIVMDFKKQRSGSSEEIWNNPKLSWSFGYSSETITVGGKQFSQSPADGPLGSSNLYPLTQTGNEIQFLSVSEGTSLIPVNFPAFSVCPCSRNYQVVLTAPMYPKE